MATQAKSESTAELTLEQLATVSERLRLVEIDVAVIKSNYATREDVAKLALTTGKMEVTVANSCVQLSALDERTTGLELRVAQMEARLIRWFVGTAITLSAVVSTIAFTAAKFIH